jgi:hypothetical protein
MDSAEIPPSYTKPDWEDYTPISAPVHPAGKKSEGLRVLEANFKKTGPTCLKNDTTAGFMAII